MTPWQYYIAHEAHGKRKKLERDSLVYVAWVGEVFHRTKKLSGKDLKRFITEEENKSNKLDGNAIMQRLKAYQKQRDNAKSS